MLKKLKIDTIVFWLLLIGTLSAEGIVTRILA